MNVLHGALSIRMFCNCGASGLPEEMAVSQTTAGTAGKVAGQFTCPNCKHVVVAVLIPDPERLALEEIAPGRTGKRRRRKGRKIVSEDPAEGVLEHLDAGKTVH